MSLAMKYAMKKHMAKGGMAECMACKDGKCMEHGGMMAEGGDPFGRDIREKNKDYHGHNDPRRDRDRLRGVHHLDVGNGMSQAGLDYRQSSERGLGFLKDIAKKDHKRVLSESQSMPKGPLSDPKKYADGGFIEEEEMEYDPMQHPMPKENMAADMEDEDMIDRIMNKRMMKMSKGGEVANKTEVVADFEPNEFDDLAKDDELEFHDTGANSGDEVGDEQEDMDRRDIVARIMRSRAKKDRMPRPA